MNLQQFCIRLQGLWNPGVVCSGHFDAVEDLAWEPAGRFLISVSADQTARLHAPWMHSVEGPITWHEIARPQIHGYDLSSIAVLGPFRYASGAEEKIIRVFEAPNNFRANLNRICGTQLSGDRLIFLLIWERFRQRFAYYFCS